MTRGARQGRRKRRYEGISARPRTPHRGACRLSGALVHFPDRPVKLPAGFPRAARALACDFDRTLVGEDALLRPRTRAALRGACVAGLRVIVVTGRMVRSVRPYLLEAGLTDPVVCYQGAVVADPASGEFLRHVPMPREVALEAIDAIQEAGFHLNCYVDDLLHVAEVTPEARAYADFQHLEIHAVGDLRAWLAADPTKLVAVGEPHALDELEAELKPHFEGRLYISKSLPFFLELASPDVSKAAGLEFVAERLGFERSETIAFGDGENDIDLLDWAGYGVAVANAHDEVLRRADLVCPSVDEEGVAQVIEAFLNSRE